jgi:hypothetical protein
MTIEYIWQLLKYISALASDGNEVIIIQAAGKVTG